MLTPSSGEKIINPRQAEGSANREKARKKVARIHARIADRRRDTLHKITTRLVRDNQVVVIEDLTVRNLLKSGRLARAISDAAWAQFVQAVLELRCARRAHAAERPHLDVRPLRHDP